MCTGTPTAALRYGDASFQDGDAIAVDTNGDYVIAASGGGGTLDLGDGEPRTLHGFLAKYNAAHTLLWVRRLDWAGIASVAFDPSGNIVAGGYIASTQDFGGGPVSDQTTYDGFIARYAPDGAYVDAKTFGIAGKDGDGVYITSIAVGTSGNVVATGEFIGKVTFGGATFTSLANGNSSFVFELDAMDSHVYSAAFDNHMNHSVALDPAGNAIAVGNHITKISPSGATLSDGLLAQGYLEAAWIAIDAASNVYITAAYDSSTTTLDFGGGPVTVSQGQSFLLKYAPSGALLWSRLLTAEGGEAYSGVVAVDPSGAPVIGGIARGLAYDLGGTPIADVTGGAEVAWVARYDAGGQYLWGQALQGQSLYDRAACNGVAVGAGHVFAIGNFQHALTIGTTKLTCMADATDQNDDIYVAEFSP